MFYRAPGARLDHLFNASKRQTACGLDARYGRHFQVSAAHDRPVDLDDLPICEDCRAASFLVGKC